MYPTSLWDPGDRISDPHSLQAPPGTYKLSVGWYRSDTGQRLPLATGGDELDLGQIQVN
jgi:hypothetical protein